MARPDGGYKLKDGTKVPGTTTITGRFKESGGLLHWAFQQGQAAERGEIKNLYDKRDEAANLGTRVHEIVEDIVSGESDADPDTSDEPQEVQSGVDAFLSWASMTKLEILAQEVPLVCECHRFGGTPDAIGYVGGKLALLDWKTSNSVYADYLIQLAAYRHLIGCGYRIDDEGGVLEWPGGEGPQGYHLLRFSKSHGDFSHHFYPDLSNAWRMFELLREAYEIDKELKKRTK